MHNQPGIYLMISENVTVKQNSEKGGSFDPRTPEDGYSLSATFVLLLMCHFLKQFGKQSLTKFRTT